MKAYLLYRDRDFELDAQPVPQEADLTRDLDLDTLLDAMAGGDKLLREMARKALLAAPLDPEGIVYRQAVLRDCIEQAPVVREIYAIAVEAIAAERNIFRSYFRSPEIVLHTSLERVEVFVRQLKKLRAVGDQHAHAFRSDGFAAFFDMLPRELGDEYIARVEAHLRDLKFRDGILISARLGRGLRGTDYVLRKLPNVKRSWRGWFSFLESSPYTLVVADRDEAGMHALAQLRARGVNLAANALAQSADHLLSFFTMVRAELAFYLGCLNLRQRLLSKGEPLCFPTPLPSDGLALSARGLYDVGLSMRLDQRVVRNDVEADGKRLILITGANQGGKSTFLRSVGQAQLMMQCGMFVAAEVFSASVGEGLFTHFKREEDPTMTSGKLDEELSRMSHIADLVGARCIVLFNESFAATNEREGAEIASAIVQALLEAGVRVLFVTHSFELADRFYRQANDDVLFLRAERLPDGGRTFKLRVGEPLQTSYGEDLYRRVFGDGPAGAVAPPEAVVAR